MSLQFTAESVFEIGIQIEKNGRQFYREAAQRTSNSSVQDLFNELAEWEQQHVVFFEELKTLLPDSSREDDLFDPDNEVYAYLEAAAGTHVFVTTTDVSALVRQCDSTAKALELAIAFEKDSIVYYMTMKKMVAEHLGRSKIETLIDEELRHLALLNSKKKHISP